MYILVTGGIKCVQPKNDIGEVLQKENVSSHYVGAHFYAHRVCILHLDVLNAIYMQVSSFKFQVLFVTYTTIQRLYNQQWNESRVRSMDSANIEKTTQGK